MRADGLLKIKATYPYGHRMYIADEGNSFRKRFPKTLEKHKKEIAYIAETLGPKNVVELERIATALLVTQTEEKEGVEEVIKETEAAVARTAKSGGGGLVSGGQGQRIRLGRGMLRQEARLVVLDEPFRGLDRGQRHMLILRARQW